MTTAYDGGKTTRVPLESVYVLVYKVWAIEIHWALLILSNKLHKLFNKSIYSKNLLPIFGQFYLTVFCLSMKMIMSTDTLWFNS